MELQEKEIVVLVAHKLDEEYFRTYEVVKKHEEVGTIDVAVLSEQPKQLNNKEVIEAIGRVFKNMPQVEFQPYL